MIWATEQSDKNKSIDTLKTTIPEMEKLWNEYGDTAIWEVYAISVFEVGWSYQVLSQFDSCFPYLFRCYEMCMAQKGEKYLLTTMCMNKLSFYYQYIGDLKKQKDLLFKSFDIRREILDSNHLMLAYAYANVAAFYREIGDFGKGYLYYDKSIEIHKNQFKIYEQTDAPFENKRLLSLRGTMIDFSKNTMSGIADIPLIHAAILLGDANTAIKRKEFNVVEQRFKEVDEVMKKYPRITPQIKIGKLRIRVDELMAKGDFRLVDKYLDTMIEYHQSVHSEEGLLTDYFQKSYSMSMIGKFDEAIDIVTRHLSSDRKKPQAYHSKLSRLSQLYLEAGLYDKTMIICDSAYHFLLTDQQYDSLSFNRLTWSEFQPATISKILYYLSMEINAGILENQKEKDTLKIPGILNRFDLFNSGLVYLQERNFSLEGKISQEIKFYPLYENMMHLAAEAWNANGDDRYVNMILNWSDAHKSIALRNALNLKGEMSLNPKSVISELFELKNEVETCKARIRKLETERNRGDSIKLANLRSSLVELTAELDILEDRHKDYLNRIYNPNDRIWFPFDKIAEYLKKNEAQLMDYFVGDKYLIVSLVGVQDKFCFSMELSPSNKAAINSLVLQVKQKAEKNEISRNSKKLYQLLIEPIKSRLNKNRLIIIPDGLLFQVPFELLEDESGDPLIKKFSIHYEFSTKLLLQKTNKLAKKAYSGFAPEYDGNEQILVPQDRALVLEDFYAESRSLLGALHYNIPEVQEGAVILGGESYTGNHVDKNLFIEKSKDARIVHLAMHALTDELNPDYSQLIFKSGSGNEPLFAFELNGWEMNSELAILSACNTGVGQYRRGDGVQSLARAFKSAGCKNIVMSLWPANDASTKQIVVGLLNNLKAGMGKADALRTAKLDYLAASEGNLKSPYYWAGLVLFGDNEAMSFQSLGSWMSWAMAALALLAGVWMVYRRNKNIQR